MAIKLTADDYCDIDDGYMKVEASEIGWCANCKYKSCRFNRTR